MGDNSNSIKKKWYENYLPFVAKGPKIQAEWLAGQLSQLSAAEGKEGVGILSRDEIKPYIRLLLEDGNVDQGWSGERNNESMVTLIDSMGEKNLLLMIECAEIYDIPKIFNLVRHPTMEMAILAIKKIPPAYEKNPLLIIDRVFHSIREKSEKLLEEAAALVMAGCDAPAHFGDNYARYKEIMMDEHILGLLYPKAK